jgi:hypothetical protein
MRDGAGVRRQDELTAGHVHTGSGLWAQQAACGQGSQAQP